MKLDPGQRAGVLTHPYLMAAFAYTGSTSPIHRGVFLARGVLGLALRPPPEAFTPLAEDLHPNADHPRAGRPADEAGDLHVVPRRHQPARVHAGELRRRRPIPGQGQRQAGRRDGPYQTRTGEAVKFAGVRELATFLADSEEVHAAFVEQLFHHLVQQPVRAYGPNTLTELRQSFAKGGFNVRKLMVDEVVLAAMR